MEHTWSWPQYQIAQLGLRYAHAMAHTNGSDCAPIRATAEALEAQLAAHIRANRAKPGSTLPFMLDAEQQLMVMQGVAGLRALAKEHGAPAADLKVLDVFLDGFQPLLN